MNLPKWMWLVGGLVTATLGSCAAPQVPLAAGPAPAAADINRALEQLARYTAQAVADPGLRRAIHDQVATRFDGDTNVLYTTLASTSDVRGQLGTAYAKGKGLQAQAGDALAAVDTLARAIPRLQIAVPVHFESWDAAHSTPWVGFAPAGADDLALKTITAFDAQGRAHTLDAQTEPDVPVIILSQNERTDSAGHVLPAFRPADVGPQTLTAQGTYQVRLIAATLIEDKEPWPYNEAETMLIAKGSGLYYHGGCTLLDFSGDYLVFNRLLGTTTSDVNFYWYEKDGDDVEFNVAVEGVSLGVKIDNSDDFLGAIRMGNGYFKGTTVNKRDLGSIIQWTD